MADTAATARWCSRWSPAAWAMWVSEVDRRTGFLRDLGMLHHLSALVVGHGQPQGSRHLIELIAEANGRRRGRGAIHFRQDHQACGALHQRTDGGAFVGTHDEIAFPMARHQAVFNLRRPHVDADQIGNLLASILATTA